MFLPSTGDPVTWARRTKMRDLPVRDRPSLKAREVPGGWECSNPESFAHGQRRTAQFACAETRRQKPRTWEVDLGFVPGWAPRTRVLTTTHPGSRKRRRDQPHGRTRPSLSTREGERSDGLERLSLDGNDGRENLGEDPKDGSRPSKGIPLREDLATHRSNRGVRRDFGHRRAEE